MDDRATDYQDYVASLGRTVCPCCGYATSYQQFFTCPLCDWAEPLAEHPAWGVATSERDELLAEARGRYLTTGSALTAEDRATWAGELSRTQVTLRKTLQKRLQYLQEPERPDASETWAEVDALLTQLDEEAERRRNAMARSASENDAVFPDEPAVGVLEPVDDAEPPDEAELPDESATPEVTRPRDLSFVTWSANYMAMIALLVIGVIFVERRYHLQPSVTLFGGVGVLYLVASIGRPWWFYATVRRVGWFAGVESDRWMKRILAVFGAVLVIGAIVAQIRAWRFAR